jgi:hypothetical protein
MRVGFGKGRHLTDTNGVPVHGGPDAEEKRGHSLSGVRAYASEDQQLLAAVAVQIRVVSGVHPVEAIRRSSPQADRADATTYGKDYLLPLLFMMGQFRPEEGDAPCADKGFVAAAFAAVTRMHTEGKLSPCADCPSMMEFAFLKPPQQRARIYSLIRTHHQ